MLWEPLIIGLQAEKVVKAVLAIVVLIILIGLKYQTSRVLLTQAF